MRLFHIQMGRDGGTERFFVTLSRAFAEAGLSQAFAVRPGQDFAADVAGLGPVHTGPFLRHTPRGAWARRRLHRAIDRFAADAILAWRAPAAGLIPAKSPAAKLVRLGDYPGHLRHFRHIDAVICNNPDIASHVERLGHPGRIEVISNFARPHKPAPIARAALNTPEDAFLICGSARFEVNKGLDTLVRAVADLPDAWLWLLGDGAERSSLEAQVAQTGLAERTRFVGWVREPMDYVAAADAFVMPSRDEPLGNALIEAWHTGTPSVTTATNGPNWYAQDGRDCLIVPVDEPAAMRVALERLERDQRLGYTLSAGARDTLAARFSKEAVVARYVALIADL
ncbi:MAG: glycosyltransferase [Pseudomonadota bacterium]